MTGADQDSRATQEPDWLSLNAISPYEQEIDANSFNPTRFRHRLRVTSGETVREWKPGPAPLTRREP